MNIAFPVWWPAGKVSVSKEQWMLIVAGVVLVVVTTQGVIPVLNRWRDEAARQLEQQRQVLAMLTAELQTIGEDDPVKVRARIQHEHMTLLAKVVDEERALQRLRAGLVNAEQITVLLTRLLEQAHGVSLLSLENEGVTPVSIPAAPPAPVTVATPAKSETGAASGGTAPVPAAVPPVVPAGPTLYRHSVRLLLRGDYRSLVRYLAKVEQLPWAIYWDEITLEVDKHPVAEVAVVFHTLSEQETWLQIT